MNAAEAVRSIEQAKAVAAVVDLFRREFPAARPNLTPWRDDPLTRRFSEEETLDLSLLLPRQESEAAVPQPSAAAALGGQCWRAIQPPRCQPVLPSPAGGAHARHDLRRRALAAGHRGRLGSGWISRTLGDKHQATPESMVRR